MFDISSVSSGIKTLKNVITANSPVLLVGTSVAGVVTTGILSAMAGYKARGIVDEKERELGRDTTLQEKAQLTWLCYAVPAVTGASSIAACIGVHTIHTKRHAAMAGLYAITANKLDDYRDKAEELLGPKKTEALNKEIAQSRIDASPTESNDFGGSNQVILAGGKELCYDEWSGRYFYGDMPMIQEAFAQANHQIRAEGELSLNTFYDFIGLPSIQPGTEFGWSGGTIDARFGSCVSEDGRPAISFWFHQEPKPNLGRR